MRIFDDLDTPEIVQLLQNGAVGVLRTDTLYGIVCSAHNEQAVERVYALKSRNEKKSPIVLIGDRAQLFDTPSSVEQAFIDSRWPASVSIILVSMQAPLWIRRGNNSVAYRMPASEQLQKLLKTTGPLIAPSANPEGEAPATTIEAAIGYFGDRIDFYVDGGPIADALPSQLVRLAENGEVERLR